MNTNTPQPKSWKKLTATLIYLAAGILLTLLQTFLHQGQTPETAAAAIVLLLIGGLVTTIFVLTQGKIDLAKYTQEGTPGHTIVDLVEDRITSIITPVLREVAKRGDQYAPPIEKER